MAYLIQLLLPLQDNDGRPFGEEVLGPTRRELIDHFGGVTAYLRAPARGLWQGDDGLDRDDIVIFEVMVDELDRPWWAQYRERVRQRFRQDELVVRAMSMDLL